MFGSLNQNTVQIKSIKLPSLVLDPATPSLALANFFPRGLTVFKLSGESVPIQQNVLNTFHVGLFSTGYHR